MHRNKPLADCYLLNQKYAYRSNNTYLKGNNSCSTIAARDKLVKSTRIARFSLCQYLAKFTASICCRGLTDPGLQKIPGSMLSLNTKQLNNGKIRARHKPTEVKSTVLDLALQ
jgi:hypothetical protein